MGTLPACFIDMRHSRENEGQEIVRPYSEDIRVRVVQSYETHEGSQRQIAERFHVSLSFVRDLLKRFRQTGSVAPKQCRGRTTSKLDHESLQLVLRLLDNDPMLPLSHLCARLAQERQIRISRTTMWRTIQKHRKAKISPELRRGTRSLKKDFVRGTSL
jgi:transposase